MLFFSFFFFTLVTVPIRSLSLKLSETRVYAPQIRALHADCRVHGRSVSLELRGTRIYQSQIRALHADCRVHGLLLARVREHRPRGGATPDFFPLFFFVNKPRPLGGATLNPVAVHPSMTRPRGGAAPHLDLKP